MYLKNQIFLSSVLVVALGTAFVYCSEDVSEKVQVREKRGYIVYGGSPGGSGYGEDGWGTNGGNGGWGGNGGYGGKGAYGGRGGWGGYGGWGGQGSKGGNGWTTSDIFISDGGDKKGRR